ncbi:MAG: GTPase domain-containing protein [Myxococcota bacterium]
MDRGAMNRVGAKPRVMFDGVGLAGVHASLEALGYGDFRQWFSRKPGSTRVVREVEFEGEVVTIDKANGDSLYRPALDPDHPRGGVPENAKTQYCIDRADALRKADGVIFVVDGQVERLVHNEERFALLLADLGYVGRSAVSIPLVLQLNKVDFVPRSSLEERTAEILRRLRWPGPFRSMWTNAKLGTGVHEAFRTALRLVNDSSQGPQ